MKRNIISIYQKFMLVLYNKGAAKVSSKYLKLFMDTFEDVLDINFIWGYISFQMEYWSSKKTNFSLESSWIFGEKAIERWNKKHDSWSYHTQQFLNKVGIERPVEYFRADLRDTFENIRKKNFGTELGLADCLSYAYYSEDSKYCKVCEYKDFCKTL